MSIKVMTWYWENSEQEGHKLLLLLALADWADDEGECYPSVSRLAQRIRRDRRTAQRAIRELEKSGELVVYPGMGKGSEGRRSSLYYLVGYRKSLSIEIPPMMIEAAEHSRARSRKYGQKGAEVRRAQAALADDEQGVTRVPPPTGDTGAAPTGDTGAAPTGDTGAAQIRQLDPSVDPSGVKGVDPSYTPSASPPLASPSGYAPAMAGKDDGHIPLRDGLGFAAIANGRYYASRQKQLIDDLRRNYTALGVEPATFTKMVEVFLRYYGMEGVASGNSERAGEVLSKAQSTILALCEVGAAFRSPDAVTRVFASWENNDWRDGQPSARQFLEHAGLMHAGRVVCEKKTPASTTKPPQELTYKEWLLRTYHTDMLATITRESGKSEGELQNDYRQWQTQQER